MSMFARQPTASKLPIDQRGDSTAARRPDNTNPQPESTLNHAYEALRKDILCIMLHDLKTPLTAFLNLPDLIELHGKMDAEVCQMLKILNDSSQQMSNLINLSLEIFKMEEGSYTLNCEEVDVLAVLGQVLEQLSTLLRKKNVTARLLLDGKPLTPDSRRTLIGEKLLIHSMLGNLIKNAVEASPEWGEVTVGLSEGPQRQIRITNQNLPSVELRERFFEKFLSSRRSDSVGLGTYSARLVAEAHGGAVSVEFCELENMTTVVIHLPTAQAVQPSEHTKAAVGDLGHQRSAARCNHAADHSCYTAAMEDGAL